MGYSILKYSEWMLSHVQDLERAGKGALRFVLPRNPTKKNSRFYSRDGDNRLL